MDSAPHWDSAQYASAFTRGNVLPRNLGNTLELSMCSRTSVPETGINVKEEEASNGES